MHRVELKEQNGELLYEAIEKVPNAPCGVESAQMRGSGLLLQRS